MKPGGIMLHKFNGFGGVFFRPNKLFAELISNNDYCIFKYILTNNNRMMQSRGASKALRTVVLLINSNNGRLKQLLSLFPLFIFLCLKILTITRIIRIFVKESFYSDLHVFKEMMHILQLQDISVHPKQILYT